ncbi:MAG: polysaccharide deacetylase family protein [Coriobacteriales bacterium]|nr:polysaccharide deacetylase family protein [Coriobacteriales bacterium]
MDNRRNTNSGYNQYNQYNSYSRNSYDSGSYRNRSNAYNQRTAAAAQATYRRPNRQPEQKRSYKPVLIVIIILLTLVLLGVGGWFLYRMLTTFPVTINGEKVIMHNGDTVATLLEGGYATPNPGNLLAMDGNVLIQGGGEPYAITVDGVPTKDTNLQLANNIDVQIGDGADLTEEIITTEEAIPFEWHNDSLEFGAYWNGSIHLLSDGREGKRVIRTGALSGQTQTEVVEEPIDSGYRIFTAQVNELVVAFTFDDGPWPETTSQILDILEQYGAHATFFTIGNQIPGREYLVQRAISLGCQVCTHTWDHANGSGQGVNITYMSPEEQINEVLMGYQAITDATGQEPARIMRAPGGNFYGETIENLWPYVDAEIGWDIDTRDWARPGVDAIVASILTVEPGQVILMHDGGGDRSQSVQALAQALPILADLGYRFVTIDELMAMSL